MVLTVQERIFIVENVLRKGGKYTKEVQELFQEKFGAEQLLFVGQIERLDVCRQSSNHG